MPTLDSSPSPAPRGGGPGRGPTEHPSRIRRWFSGLAALRANRPAELFLLCWIVPSWIVFELVSTKLPHYTMPLYPAIALLTARAAIAFPGLRPAPNRLDRIGWWVWCVLGLGLVAAAILGIREAQLVTVVRDRWSFAAWTGLVAAIIAFTAVLKAAMLVAKQRPDRALRAGLVVQVIVLISVCGIAMPQLAGLTRDAYESAQSIAQEDFRGDASETLAPHKVETAWVDFWEDSVVFLSRGSAIRIKPEEAPDWLRKHPNGCVVGPARFEPELENQEWLWAGPQIGGHHYTKGRFAWLRANRYYGHIDGKTSGRQSDTELPPTREAP